MWYGWTGTGLEVDLSQKRIKKIPGDRDMYQAYLGGLGLITKFFWDRVPPEVEPFSPENLLIFGAGPLVGTAAQGGNRTTVVTKSPQTNHLTYSCMGGFWGPELKFAGYDTLSISGKSATPVYIYIHDDKVEIRDASHLWGKDVFETQRLLRKELKDEKLQSLAIGPAGENRVFYASIEHGNGSSLSRTGVGAIMGDKNLKAIAVYGSGDVNIAKPAPFFELYEEILNRSHKAVEYADVIQHDSSVTRRIGSTYRRNLEFKRKWKEAGPIHMEWLAEHEAAKVGCFNCTHKCIRSPQLSDGQPIYIKCRSPFRFINAGDVDDFDYNLRCIALTERDGLCLASAAAVCAFAIDLYQKGILTEKDTDGLHLEWGTPEVIPALLEKIIHRQGFGDILANGIYLAAKQIGRGAEQYAYHVRKSEFRGQHLQLRNAASYILSDRLDNAKSVESGGRNPLTGLSEYAPAVNRQYPPDWDEFLNVPGQGCALNDCLGICKWQLGTHAPAATRELDLAQMFLYATGADMDEEDVKKSLLRGRAHIRAFNAILGERMSASDLPSRFVGDPAGPEPLVDRDELSKMIIEANQLAGYDGEGIPRGELLEELGLDNVAQELKRRGILPEPAALPRQVRGIAQSLKERNGQ